MSMGAAIWMMIILALVSANLPFLNQRLFALIRLPLGTARKSFWLRLLELVVLYFVIGGVAYYLEASLGNAFSQGWEFYVVSACLFIVFAFPGFVFQYLRRV